MIRRPDAVRPWQHVLEPLAGYLALAEQLAQRPQRLADAWNVGPSIDDARAAEQRPRPVGRRCVMAAGNRYASKARSLLG